MSKSKFPNQIDSSIEIPAVRDNIIEVGSDVINSLRSAIFQIEKTLGINPQGNAGNTVAKRLDRALDGNGNILKEALNQSNLLVGPIGNQDISKTAAISESKLKLNFPTNLLQDEISILDSQLESIISQIEELSVKLSSHIHPDAINRHKAQAITVDEISGKEGSSAISSTKGGTAQEVFEEIFSSHINYNGESTSSENKSHSASQIYFDNTNVVDRINSINTQDVIEEILNIGGSDISNHQNLFHSNGLLRSTSSIGWTTTGEQLPIIGPVKISFAGAVSSNSARIFTIYFDEPIDISSIEILKSDILEITDNNISTKFQINDLIIENDLLSGLALFGNLNSDSTLGTMGSVYKNKNQPAQLSSLLIGIRPDINHTSAETIQIADPRSTSIFTYGLRPFEINADNRYLELKIDGGSAIKIDLYDADQDQQSVDSIVNRINIQLLSGAHPALAYRAEMPYGGVEIAIVHNIPSNPDKDYSLKVTKSSDEGIVSAGLSYVDGIETYSIPGSYFYINGLTNIGLKESMSRTDLFATDATPFIESSDLSILNDNVLKNNLINVFKENNVETYKISALSDLKITVDIEQIPNGFSNSSEISKFEVYENTISFESHTFDEINSNFASGIFDIFIASDGHLISNKILSYESNYSFGADSAISIVDFSGVLTEDKFIFADILDKEQIRIYFGPNEVDMNAKIKEGSSIIYDKALEGSSIYRTLTHGLFSLKIYINNFSTLYNYINSSNNIPDSGSIRIPINLFSDVNREENIHVGRVHYESGIGRISGAGSNMPRAISSLQRGTTGFKDISSNAIYKLLHEPTSELRSNGVINGLSVLEASDGKYLNNQLFKLSISEGVCYVAGKRFEISGGIDITTDIDSQIVDKFYIAINSLGEFVFSPAGATNCQCQLDTSTHCILGVAEWDNVSLLFYDLRLFVNNIDLKILNAITVSPEPGMGHFSDLNLALQYAKRFSEIFPKAGIPNIHMKSGTHIIEVDMNLPLYDENGQPTPISQDELILSSFNAGLVINFPVKITGEGDSTVLDIRRVWEDDTEDLRGSPPSAGSRGLRQEGVIYILGDGVTDAVRSRVVSTLDDGFVEISSIKLRQCKIAAFGMNTDKTVDNIDYELNCGVMLNDLFFDYSDNKSNDPNDPNPNQSRVGQSVFILAENGNQTVDQGNVFIENCNFIFSKIIFANINPGSLKNISIINNKFLGTGLKSSTAHSGGAFEMIGADLSDGTIFDPYADNYGLNNINIYGNVNRSNPSDGIDGQTSRGWGDRVNKDLIIGKNIGIKNGFPKNDLVIGSGRENNNPVIELSNPLSLEAQSRIVITEVVNNQPETMGSIGYCSNGHGGTNYMFMSYGDKDRINGVQDDFMINNLGLPIFKNRSYFQGGITVSSANISPNRFENTTRFDDMVTLKADLVIDGINSVNNIGINTNTATGGLSGIRFWTDGAVCNLNLSTQGFVISPPVATGGRVRLLGSELHLPGENYLVQFDGQNSGINIDGSDSAINLMGLRNKLQTLGNDCQINLNGASNEINLNGGGSKININTGFGAGIYLNNASQISLNSFGSKMNCVSGSQIDMDVGASFEFNSDGVNSLFSLNNIPTIGVDATMEPLGVFVGGGSPTVVGIHPAGLSSLAIKRDIADLDIGLQEVNKMRPVSYVLKYDKDKRVNIGLVVEEMASVDKRMVIMGPKVTVEDGRLNKDYEIEAPVPYKWEAREVVPVLIKAIQELSQKVKDLEEKTNA